jgi:hypothetical protein
MQTQPQENPNRGTWNLKPMWGAKYVAILGTRLGSTYLLHRIKWIILTNVVSVRRCYSGIRYERCALLLEPSAR